jgi:hypothetical protein
MTMRAMRVCLLTGLGSLFWLLLLTAGAMLIWRDGLYAQGDASIGLPSRCSWFRR